MSAVKVDYLGLDPTDWEFFASPEFSSIIKEHKYTFVDEENKRIPKITEDIDWVFVKDKVSKTKLCITPDDSLEVEIKSEGFEELLHLMDIYTKNKLGIRQFVYKSLPENDPITSSRPDVTETIVIKGMENYEWEFDIKAGKYINPNV